MANTLTNILPTLYSAAQIVQDENVGCLEAIQFNFDDKETALNDAVTVPIAPAATTANFTPAATSSSGTDKVAGKDTVTLDTSKKTAWHLTGEQIRSLENAETDKEWARQLLAQGMRAIRNQAETSLADVIYQGASRAIGTAGTTPFASSLDILAEAIKELNVNGAPNVDLQMVMDPNAAFNIRKLNIFQAADAAGSDEERRSGKFGRQFGFALRESNGIALHTNGTGANYVSDGIEAVGQTTVTVKTGTGTIVVGDYVTYANDTNKYVCAEAIAAAGDLVIGKKGLLDATADGEALTVGEDYMPNVAFERSAVIGIWRPPLIPENPTIKKALVSDDHGMTYLLLEIAQYGQITWELHAAYGFDVVNPEYIINIMG